jgi:hypothetical protein
LAIKDSITVVKRDLDRNLLLYNSEYLFAENIIFQVSPPVSESQITDPPFAFIIFLMVADKDVIFMPWKEVCQNTSSLSPGYERVGCKSNKNTSTKNIQMDGNRTGDFHRFLFC